MKIQKIITIFLKVKKIIASLQRKMDTQQIHIWPKSRFSECDYRGMANLVSLSTRGVMYLFKP